MNKSDSEESCANAFWAPSRMVLSLIVFALIAAFGLSSCSKSNDNDRPRATVSTPAASTATSNAAAGSPRQAYNPSNSIAMPAVLRDARLETVDGKTIKLSDFAGKVVVLNLWATWCMPCRQETPELIDMSKEFSDKGVAFIGIATSENESQNGVEGVKNFVRGYKVPYDMVYTDSSFSGPLQELVRARAVIPQSFVISKDGRFVAHFQGFNPQQTPTKLRAVIEQATEEAPQS